MPTVASNAFKARQKTNSLSGLNPVLSESSTAFGIVETNVASCGLLCGVSCVSGSIASVTPWHCSSLALLHSVFGNLRTLPGLGIGNFIVAGWKKHAPASDDATVRWKRPYGHRSAQIGEFKYHRRYCNGDTFLKSVNGKIKRLDGGQGKGVSARPRLPPSAASQSQSLCYYCTDFAGYRSSY